MEYRPAFIALAFGAVGFLIATWARWIDSRIWRRSLIAYRVRLPRDLPLDSVTAFLSIVSGSTRRRPLVFEIAASTRGIGHYILIPSSLAAEIVTKLSTALPGARCEEAPDYLLANPGIRVARELRTTRAWRPLATDRAPPAITGLLSSLYPLFAREVVRVQWIFCAAPRFIRVDRDAPADIARAVANKQSFPLLDACGRIAVSATQKGRAMLLLSSVLNAMDVMNGPGVAVRPKLLPTPVVTHRVYARSLPLGSWPAVLNTLEAAALIAFPAEGITVPGLQGGSSRQLPPAPEMRRSGLVVAHSTYPGMEKRALTLAPQDRLRHMFIQGPTGSGKSELIANLALQDIDAGYGVVVIDPKSDLVEAILARIPEKRCEDVIVMDASDTGRPIGFNVLSFRGDEHSGELVVDRIVHIFAELWRSSWGPRTADCLRAGLLSLTHTRAADGQVFTLAELPALLTVPSFRRYVTSQSTIPESVREFWSTYEQMSVAERHQVIGPSLNKLRAFTTRTSLKLMLGQSDGLDLGDIFRKRKILLVPLSKGIIGPDAAHLLGSLLVALLWQETLSRASIPSERRRPVWCYLDEFQEFCRFSGGELADILAQARGLGLGLVLAFQFLDQIPRDVRAAVLGDVRTQVLFQLEYGDAAEMAKRFAPLTRDDLSGLDAWEVAIRPCVNARTLPPVTGRTTPLGDPVHEPRQLSALSRARYGMPRALVDQAHKERLHVARSERPASQWTPESGDRS